VPKGFLVTQVPRFDEAVLGCTFMKQLRLGNLHQGVKLMVARVGAYICTIQFVHPIAVVFPVAP
jgi:hypothetical protein